MNHIHNYRLLGQFEGTPKMYECSVLYCHDQADENQVADYEQHIREFVQDAQANGN